MLSKNFKIIAIIIVLIFIISVSLIYSCSNIVPYSKENSWYYKYEGMKDISGNKMDISGNKINENKMDLSSNIIENFHLTRPSPPKKNIKQNFKTLEGFEGIYGSVLNANEIIDVFGNSNSSVNCYGSGLTNSGGSLCLNDKQKQLLTTRGGNATGASLS